MFLVVYLGRLMFKLGIEMQPDEHQDFSIDYLDEIASPSKGPGLFDKRLAIVSIIGAIVVVIFGAFMLFGGSGGQEASSSLPRLGLRLYYLQSTVDSSGKNIKSSALRTANTNLSLLLTNANRDLAPILAANSVDMKKVSPKLVASESTAALANRLESARLNALFDRTYAREMAYQLETLTAMMTQLETTSKSKYLKDYLNKYLTQIKPINQQFSDFSAASS